LGVPLTADWKEITLAYRAKAKEFHPDRLGGDDSKMIADQPGLRHAASRAGHVSAHLGRQIRQLGYLTACGRLRTCRIDRETIDEIVVVVAVVALHPLERDIVAVAYEIHQRLPQIAIRDRFLARVGATLARSSSSTTRRGSS
jgi:hypothetical protein